MAKIRLKFNQAIIKEYALDKDILTFGRKEGNDIVIPHPAVSGFHGKLVKEGEDLVVEDLNSTNGTFINGRKVKRSKVADKDNIRVAKHIMEYIASDEPVAAPPPPPELSGEPIQREAPAPVSSVDAQKEILKKTLQESAAAAPAPAPAAAAPAAPVPPAPTAPAPQNSPSQALPPGAESTSTSGPKIPKIKVVSGGGDGPTEWELKELNTYIGTSPKAQIKIKGFLAPDLAAAITKRPEGFYLKAIKAGYPKVNGKAVQEQVLLENGTSIECGSLTMLFILSGRKS